MMIYRNSDVAIEQQFFKTLSILDHFIFGFRNTPGSLKVLKHFE